MSAQHTPAREWRVVVHHNGVGDIGSVVEATEELARCAALSKFGTDARRAHRGTAPRASIYVDDDFDVRPS